MRAIETLRFRTIDVIENLDGVMEVIYAKCCERAQRTPFTNNPDRCERK